MTLPAPAASGWFTGTINAAKMQSNLTDPINAVAWGFIGGADSNTAVTLATVGTDVASSATYTFTLAVQRRVEIYAQARYSLGTTTNGIALLQVAYSVGSSANTASMTKLRRAVGIANYTAQTGAVNAPSNSLIADALLSAGTYTAFAAVQRALAGSATDTANGFVVLVKDIGPT